MNTAIPTNKYDLAARITIAELDGFAGRLTASQQRTVFGRNVFGKKYVQIDASNQGTVKGHYSCAFGTDTATFELSFEELVSQLGHNHISL